MQTVRGLASIMDGGVIVISNQIIQDSINDLSNITENEFWVADINANLVASTYEGVKVEKEVIDSLLSSVADNIEVQNDHYFKVYDRYKPLFVLAVKSGKDGYLMGKIAVSQIQRLITAYKEKYDKNSFFQNLLLDNLLLAEIYNRAKQLKIEIESKRIIFVIETFHTKDNSALETVKSIFSEKNRHFVTEVDEHSIILVKRLHDGETLETQEETAHILLDMLNTEAMSKVRVSYGTIVNDIKSVSKSYKEAKMALDVGKIFYPGKTIISYSALGIGRLIYQLPMNLCDMFLDEALGMEIQKEIDEETLNTITTFFENNLNISETARQLYLHRNTLTYRLEKFEKLTGLDVKNFEDAMTFKIALMVSSYKRYMESKKDLLV